VSMTVVSIKQTDEKSHVTNAGPQIVADFKVQFTGTFSTVYIYQNAEAMGLIDIGEYLIGTSSDMYVSETSAGIVPGSLYVGTTTQPGVFMYSTTFSTIDRDRMDLSPIFRPAKVNGGGIELTEVSRVDSAGNAKVNSVGDYYEGIPESYIPGSEFTISWNVATNPATLAQTFSFSANQSSIWGQSSYAGIIRKITYENVYEVFQGVLIQYFRITVPIAFRNDGIPFCQFQPFDVGYRYKSGSTVKNYVDPTTGVYGEVFLDGSGGLLNGNGTAPASGSPPVIYPAASGSTPAGYQTITAQNWSGLSFPVSPFA
jgi:hypothetical protein